MSQPEALPFRLKFCGLRRASDVCDAIDAGADAIGLNFCPSSPRFIETTEAAALSLLAQEHATAKKNKRIWRVGVFVNPSLRDLDHAMEKCQLDMIQLHGEEKPTDYRTWRRLPIIKAVTWRQEADGTINADDELTVATWRSSATETRLLAFLVDAYDPVLRGGTGRVVRWDLLSPRPAAFAAMPIILAGGLNAVNVAEAIRVSQTDAVDTASGIECGPGLKDWEKMRMFARNASVALVDRLNQS